MIQFAFGSALAAIALAAAASPATPAAPEDTALVATQWTLKKPAAGTASGQARRAGTGVKAARNRASKPRVFGGAAVTNGSGRNKAGAKVGVALPF